MSASVCLGLCVGLSATAERSGPKVKCLHGSLGCQFSLCPHFSVAHSEILENGTWEANIKETSESDQIQYLGFIDILYTHIMLRLWDYCPR